MNVKFCYLYRDGANYKLFNEAVFSNPGSLSIIEIEATIKEKLIEGQWFIAKEWGLPEMYFREYAWNSEIDHDRHEFEAIEETLEEVTEERTIEDFIFLLKKIKIELSR